MNKGVKGGKVFPPEFSVATARGSAGGDTISDGDDEDDDEDEYGEENANAGYLRCFVVFEDTKGLSPPFVLDGKFLGVRGHEGLPPPPKDELVSSFLPSSAPLRYID